MQGNSFFTSGETNDELEGKFKVFAAEEKKKLDEYEGNNLKG